MARRADALFLILDQPEKFEEYKGLLQGIDIEVHKVLKLNKSTPENVQKLINEAKEKGLPTEAIKAILPPKVTVVETSK